MQDKLRGIFESQSAEIDAMVEKLIEILEQRIVEDQGEVKDTQMLAVRSSSTLEDLDKMAGAGLFDSILNVPLSDPKELRKAIVDVWLSLYTQRATISRK